MRPFIIAVMVVTSLTACGSSHRTRPQWVSTGVITLRSYFVGKPRPETTTWGRSIRGADWVTITFAVAQTCTLCHGPTESVVRGRRATITWTHSPHKATSVTIQEH